MDAAFLVQDDQKAEFVQGVRELERQFPSLVLKLTGPAPPNAFVNIRLKLEKGGAH
jgi:hypothetical protein